MEKNKTDSLKNFDIDFGTLKQKFFSFSEKIFQKVMLCYFRYHPKGAILDAGHIISLKDGMISYVCFHDGSKKPEIKISYSGGKITLRERKEPGSTAFYKKKSWTSEELFFKEFTEYLSPKPVEK